MKNFITPHCHIASLDSGSTAPNFAKREVELGTGAITCTDHGTMSDCYTTYKLAKKYNLTPILGVEAYLRDDDCEILKKHGIEKVDGTTIHYQKYYHITLHAKNQVAYQTLVRVLSNTSLQRVERHGQELKPLFTWSDLEELGKHDITFTSGCLIGVVQRHLLGNRPDIAVAYYDKVRSIAKPGNFYVEVFPHRCTHDWVDGVFLTLADGTKLKYYSGKTVRTNLGEFKVTDLAKMYLHKAPPQKLLAVKNNRKWDERSPIDIVDCKMVKDFMQNECTETCPDGDVQLHANKFVLDLAAKYGDKVLISDDSHFARPEEKIVQDSKLANGPGAWRFFGSYHRQESAEAAAYFKTFLGVDDKTIEQWIENSYEFAAGFKDMKLQYSVSLPTSFYPKDTLEHTKNLIEKKGRMDWSNEAMVSRLKEEIKLLHGNGSIDLLPYFFVGEDVCSAYEENEELTGPGRGSAAGVLLTYLLGITHVNPLQHGLSLDRFLTLDRILSGKLPDIDQDLPSDKLLTEDGWLDRRFGEHCAQISTNQLLRIRSSIKDVAKSKFGFVPNDIEEICKVLPTPPQGIEDYSFVFGYKGDDGKEVKGILETDETLQNYVARYPDHWDVVTQMLGITRQKSRHASAFVICDKPIKDIMPVMRISDRVCTQYTMGDVEAVGGIKMDFLKLNSLKDIQHALKLIRDKSGKTYDKSYILNNEKVPRVRIVAHEGRLLDIWKLPEDQKVFNDICVGDTATVFQFNTSSAKKWLKKFNYKKANGNKIIDSVEAMAVFTALDRPGPLDAYVGPNNILEEYAHRASGETPNDPIPFMDKLLPETYGLMVFQEQLQKVYQYLTDCTSSQAEEFRGLVAKKKMEQVLKAYPNFIQKATAKIGSESAQKMWDTIVTWGQYGFNKSHAVCYAYIAYACAWLKRYYPLEWWCSVLRHAKKDEIPEKFWVYCNHLVDPPDVNNSGENFEIHAGRIKAPIGFLDGVGAKAQEELAANKPYTDITDFCNKIVGKKQVKEDGTKGRSALHKGVVSKMIISGTMDSLFTPGLTDLEKLQVYTVTLANLLKQKPKPVDDEYLNMDVLTRYQIRKTILPVHREDLQESCYRLKCVEGMEKVEGVNEMGETDCYYKVWDSMAEDYIRIVNAKELNILNGEIINIGKFNVGAIGFVNSVRQFSYNKDGTRMTAVGMNVDFEGVPHDIVRWPTKKKNVVRVPDKLVGSICLFIFSKWKEDRPLSLLDIQVIRGPYERQDD